MSGFPRLALTVPLLLGLAWLAPATGLEPDGDAPLPAWRTAAPLPGPGLQALGDGTWQLRQVVDYPLPGTTPGTNAAGVADACLDLVRAQPQRFAAINADTLRLRRLHPVPFRRGAGLLWSVEFEQVVDGRPLEELALQFHVEDRASRTACAVRMLLGRFAPTVTALPAPQLNPAQCRQAAANKVLLPVGALRITRETASARLWGDEWVPVRHLALGHDGLDLIVHQVSGEVAIESLCQCLDTVTVQASLSTDTDDPDNHTTNPLRNLAVVHAGGTVYTDANGHASVPDGAVSDIAMVGLHAEVIRWDGGGAIVPGQTDQITGTGTADFTSVTEFDVAENEAYYHTDAVWTYLSTRIDTAVADSFFDTFVLEVQVNFNDTCNANFQDHAGELNGGGPRMRLFRAGGCHNTSFGDVIYHEYGHYIDWAMGGIFEKGGLSEGWSDILSAFITDDPELAEGLTANPFLRNADNSIDWSPTPSRVHVGGTAFAGFAWDIRQALGLARAEELMYAALEANTISVPDSVFYVDVFDVLDGGDAASQAAIQTAAENHALESYLAGPFRITSMTCDVGFTWQGSPVTATIEVTVENTGLASRQITVTLTGTDVAIPADTTATLAAGANETLTFQWDLSATPAGVYDVLATATSAGAPDDTATVHLVVGSGTSVFFDDFESGLGQWSTLTGTWATESANAFSGTTAISDSPGDVYVRSQETVAVTNTFSLVGIRDTRVSLWQAHWMEHDFDYGTLEMSANGGEWMALGVANGFANLHHVSYDASAFDGMDNVRVRLRLWTDIYFNHDGWFVDDLRVYGTADAGSVAATVTQLAYDGFESNDFTGGNGWSAGWSVTGDATIQSTGPAAGTRHARLRGATAAGSRADVSRFTDISGQQRVRLRVLMWTDGERVETFEPQHFPSDYVHVSVTDDGGANWTPWFTFYNGYSSTAHDYHLFDTALADLGLSATANVGIRFQCDDADSNVKLAFLDEVLVYTENHPPVFDPVIGNQAVEPLNNLQFTVAATDLDGHAVTLSAINLPAGATFTPGSGLFDWTPTNGQGSQQFTVTFRADDGVAPLVTMDVIITVGAAGNSAPYFDPVIGDMTVDVGQLVQFTVSATDDDVADTVTLGALNLPAGASFTPGTGAFDWTPTSGQASQMFTITFTADDGKVAAPVEMVVTITVNAEGGGGGGDGDSGGGCSCSTGNRTPSDRGVWLAPVILLLTMVMLRRRRDAWAICR